MNIKPFWITIARDGDTTDGRNISAETLKEMADTYSLDYYAARVFPSLLRGPHTTHIAYILAAKVELQGEDTLLRALFEPNERWFSTLAESELQSLPVYPALEYLPNMADSKRPYIIGVFLTDSPAITGLEPLNKHMVKP